MFVISVVKKQYKTKEINSLGQEKLVCYIRYFVISDLFISSFHCIYIGYCSKKVNFHSTKPHKHFNYSLTILQTYANQKNSCKKTLAA